MTKSAKKYSGATWQRELDALCDGLIAPSELYFPVRHHSPACALHLSRLIEAKRPASILIEGPETLNEYIPALANPELAAPVALYMQYTERRDRAARNGEEPESGGAPDRFGAYYPLCDYSPELIAIREGGRIGAKVAFCDLDYASQAAAGHGGGGDADRKVASLLDERYFAQSGYLRELAKRSGCRDTNELWDRLFESAFCDSDTDAFMRKVATYCFFARVNTPEEELQRDGTLAREACMRAHVKTERNRLKRRGETRPLLVVTGGFHTPPLVLHNNEAKSGQLPKRACDDGGALHALLPYSFEQLDALNGYAAGMPSPAYYQRLWETAAKSGRTDLEEVSRSFLVELPHATREAKRAHPLSTADAIAAHQQACNLARFRGNPGPMREDVLDGIRSSFVKGALDVEGEMVLQLARRLLCGDAVGRLPEGVRTHPLLEDFRERARQLGLALDSSAPRQVALHIYEKEKHRRISRFFRRLQFLDVPFARFTGGPDFVSGANLALQIEHWVYAWTPHTDSALVNLTPKGTSIEEAVVTALGERQAAIEAGGAGEGSAEAVALLPVCCRLGLYRRAAAFIPFVYARIEQDGNFESCVQATAQLDLLCHFRSPLDTGKLDVLPDVLQTAYARSCYLMNTLATLPEERVPAALESLSSLHELASSGENAGLLDPELLWDAAGRQSVCAGLEPGLAGGLLGMLFTAGRRSREELLAALEAQFDSHDAKGATLGRFLFGLFTLCRELTWNDRALMERIGRCISSWQEDEFYSVLPELRLAFAQHTPQETDRTAKLVARIGAVESIGEWYNRNVDEAFAARCAQAAARAAESLQQDRLETF